jgi:iron(III) transport system substrate-binding protein
MLKDKFTFICGKKGGVMFLRRFFVLLLLASSIGLLASCAATEEASELDDLTGEALIAAAQAEGKVVVYSSTSRIRAAAELFTAKYGIQVESTNLNDSQMIEKVFREVGGNIAGADFVLAQDSGRVFGQLINTGYLVNYVPVSMRDVIPVKYQSPLTHQFINKVFIFNSERGTAPVISNVWELTDPEWAGRVQFKDPAGEGVNYNFLTMITNPEWSQKLAEAYQDHYGRPIQLTTENAGYEWIQSFFNNSLLLGNSDTRISENVGTKGQPNTVMGLFVYSKKRYDASKDLALTPMTEISPFSGFYYPMFLQMTKNAQNPYAARLFIEFLLTEEGFSPWGKDVGSYSSNPTIPVNSDDEPLNFWEPRLVLEEPFWLFQNRSKVEEFVEKIK